MVVIDYIILHELAHSLNATHTPRFWSIVRASTRQDGKSQGLAEGERTASGAGAVSEDVSTLRPAGW
jgi:hypothetical protein